MTASPKRHWFRFSLRTLFLVVTVGAMLAWYASLGDKKIQIVGGEISHSDLAAIQDAIDAASEVTTKKIALIEVVRPGKVSVQMAGVGSGQMLGLDHTNGKWAITSIGRWDS